MYILTWKELEEIVQPICFILLKREILMAESALAKVLRSLLCLSDNM